VSPTSLRRTGSASSLSSRRRRARRFRRALDCADGPFAARLRAYAAVPDGAQKAASQAVWMWNVRQHPQAATLRADAYRNLCEVAWVVCRYADWRTMVTRPGWGLIRDRTKLSRSTVARYLALLHAWGLLGRVRAGSTWRTRGCDVNDRDGNLAGEYVLTTPHMMVGQESPQATSPVDETRTPSLGPVREPEKPLPRARVNVPDETTNLWPIGRAPVTRRDQLHAAERLRAVSPTLRRLSGRYLRHLLRPVFAAGWSPAQVVYALDHTPDETPRWHTADVVHVAAWMRHRLRDWQREDGTWVTPATPLGVGRTTDLSAADVAALPRPGERSDVDVETHASVLRRLLAATKRRGNDRPQLGLGVMLPDRDGARRTAAVEWTAPVDRNPFAVDDPRHKYAVEADEDRVKDLTVAAEAAEQHRRPSGVGAGLEWLTRGMERRGRSWSVSRAAGPVWGVA
jgi:hypothetical protein